MIKWAILSVAFGIFVCLAPAASAQLETRASFPVASYPYFIAAGDFNHDGAQDVAVTCFEALCGGGIQVLLGRGDGTFASATTYVVPNSPEFGIAVADLNGDGDLDIVVSEYLGTAVAVLLGKGDGTFQPIISSPALPGGQAVRVGDFNSDGILDLALQVTSCPGPCISVLLGKGDGSFQSSLTLQLSEYIEDLVVGDLNRDGNLDIIWESSISTDVHVLLGKGDGTFRSGPVYTVYATGPDSLALGDLNGDDVLDLVSTGGLFADVFLGNGDGTFGPDMNFSIAFGGDSTRIIDMNGDGIPDLVFPGGNTASATNVAIRLGRGDGTFGSESFFPSGEAGYALAIADFNGDHQPDVAVADQNGNAVINLLNTGPVSFSPSTTLKFLQQLVGTPSPTQTVKLTNTGASALGITSIKVGGRGLAMQNDCGSSVAPSGSCNLRVRFQPTVQGSVQGAVTLVDTASTKPQVIPIVAAATVVGLSPSALNFGPQKVGTKSAPQDVTITNAGASTVTFTSIDVTTTNYSETNTCGTQLVPGASCAISVTFNPTVGGPAIAVLNVTDNGGSSPQVVAVQGRATK
ncbi:MAG: VCBS repeat-containing protein [Acidobacteriales bacterium]|nr:VCBS repeat-containing protein [Terriglobales bacterium]